MKALAIIIMLVFYQGTAFAGDRTDIWILIDLSDSSPQVAHDPFAKKSARAVDEYLEPLALGSRVYINTFGEYSQKKNIISFKFQLLNKKGSRPKDVRKVVSEVISRLPELVRKGKLQLQKETSLVGALKLLEQRINLSAKNIVIILSDLLEYSSDANAYKLVKQQKGWLPAPESKFLEGVEVVALGGGFGVTNSHQNDRLKAIWTTFFKQAGVSRFVYLTDF